LIGHQALGFDIDEIILLGGHFAFYNELLSVVVQGEAAIREVIVIEHILTRRNIFEDEITVGVSLCLSDIVIFLEQFYDDILQRAFG